ncbi:MAG: flagellar biosynthetic protein FlhB [Blastopirellula sp.]|nr:MAG: flagellar biosynthetic protein FlhB [Blastopirellula sp.]
MADEAGEKSEDPTPHRREQAREKGQIAKSQDLISAGMLMIMLLTLMYLGSDLINFLGEFARDGLNTVPPLQADFSWSVNHCVAAMWRLGLALVPILLVIFAGGIFLNMMQTGIIFLPNKLGFDFSRISPAAGVKRLISLQNAVKLGFGIFKIFIVAGVAIFSLWADLGQILHLTEQSVLAIAMFLLDTALWTSIKIAAALLILALLDYGFQLWKQEQDLKMTKQEMREEMKTLQGDPQMVARRKQVARQLAMARMSEDIPNADVVVTNPTELAIALRYDPLEMAAPIVVAKGAGLIAQRIRRMALENNIPIVERKELARALYAEAEIDHPISAERFGAVAEVLRYVYDLQGKPMPTMEEMGMV